MNIPPPPKKRFKTVKIITTWHCNLNCSYCCNKDLRVKSTFKPITQQEIEKTNYDDYQITGGEPMLPSRFSQTICILDSIPQNKNIYLYTNGFYLSDPRYVKILKRHRVNGINIGYHNHSLAWRGLQTGMKILPMRLWVKEDEYKPFMEQLGFEKIIKWKLGDCYNINTDRFYLKLGAK